MTTVIDERVVEMRFNNADFEKNVAQSMSTLDKLKNALKFDGGAKSLEELGKAAGNFKLSGITETISEATSKFSIMEIAGVTAIAKITSSIMDMGTKLVKSLSVDQVTAGFSKYEDKTTAIQTIMAATAKDYTNQKEQLEDINNQMSKLMWFTDETSYNFVDMVGNIGKFTSQKVPLNDAVTAMQGIANWAAKSGQNAQAASRAMYNISQAMGAGSMKQKDWMSIENANMATYEFKETAAETAVQLGRLRKVADGLYETLDGKQFTIEQFREELKSGWFDKEVMSQTFAVYGRFTDVLYALSEATDKTATELLQDLDAYNNGTLDLQEYSEETKISVEDLTAAFEELNAETNEVGKTAFKNAQEAKTFGEVIDSVKDAVSTKWTETFEIIFGNYLEAKKLWTGLANDLWEVFAGGIDDRNEVLGIWKELGGRDSLIRGVIEWANLLVRPLSAIKQAFFSLLPDAEGMGQVLKDITDRFKELGEKLQPSQEMLDNIFRTFRGLFSLAGMIRKVFAAIIKAIVPAARPFGTLFEMILRFTGYVGVVITAVAEYADEVGLFESITAGLVFAFEKLFGAIKTVLSVIGGALLFVATTVGSVFGKVITKIAEFLGKTQLIAKTIDTVTKVVNFLKNTFSSTEKPIEKVNKVIKKSEEYFGAAVKSGAEYGEVTKEIGDESKKALTPLQKLGEVLKKIVAVLGLAATTIAKIIVNLWDRIRGFFDGIKQRLNDSEEDKNVFVIIFEEIFSKLEEILSDAKDALKEFFDNLGIDTTGVKEAFATITGALGTFLKNMNGGKIAAIALSIALLALVGKAIDLSSKIGTLTSAMSGFFTNINKILKKQFLSGTNFLTDLAKAFALVAGSLALLIYVDKDNNKLLSVAATMGVLMVVMVGLAAAVERLSTKFAEGKILTKGFTTLSATIIALASSVLILATACAIMSQIKIEDVDSFYTALVGAISMLAAVVGASILLTKYAVALPHSAILILAMSFAMKKLSEAMVEFSTLEAGEIIANWKEIAAMFVGMSAVIAASGLINIRSALGLMLTSKAIEMLLPQLKSIVRSASTLEGKAFIDECIKKLDGMRMFIFALFALFAMIKLLDYNMAKMGKVGKVNQITSLFSGIGGLLAGFGIGVFLIVQSINSLHKIFGELAEGELDTIVSSIKKIIYALGLFTLLIGAVSFFVNRINQGFDNPMQLAFVKMGVMLVALSVAVRIMASAIAVIASVENQGGIFPAIVVIGVLGALLSIVVGVAGTVPKAIPAIAALIGVTISLGILIGELAVLTLLVSGFKEEVGTLVGAVGIMAAIFVGLRVLMTAISNIRVAQIGTMIGLTSVIGIIGAVIVALTLIENQGNTGAAFAACLGMASVLGILALVFNVIGQMDTPSFKKMLSILSIAGTIAAIGFALWLAAKQPWESIAAAGAAMVATLGMIAAVLIVLDKIGSQGGQLGAAGAIAAIGFALIELGLALRIMDDIKVGEASAKVAALLGIVSGIVLIFGAISAIPAFGQAFAVGMLAFGGALMLVASAFEIFALSIGPLAAGVSALTPALKDFVDKIPLFELAAGLRDLATGLAAIGLAGLFLGLGSLGIIALSASLGILGLVAPVVAEGLKQLADIPMIDIALGLAAIGAVGAVFGIFAPLLIAAAMAITIFGGSLLILKAGLDAVDGMFDWFVTSISSSVETMVSKIKEIPTAINDLFSDISSAFSGPGAMGCVTAMASLGLKMAGGKSPDTGFIGGLASALGWHSTPDVEEELMDDMAGGFTENDSVVAAAESSGSQIGNGFGKSFFDSASKWFSNLGASASSWLSNLSAAFHGTSTTVQSDLSSAGAATEKFGNTTEKTTDGIIDKIKNGYHKVVDPISEKVNKQIEETTNNLFGGADATNYITEQIEEATKAAEDAATGMEGYGDATEAAGKKAGGAAKDIKSLKDTLEGQLDLFSKFEMKTELTSETLLENMKSNIDGWASWSHRMTEIAKRLGKDDIATAIYGKLEELGPKGYETMNAIYQMTDEQINLLRERWAVGMNLPESQADIVNAGATYIGEMAVKGFSNALDDHTAAHNAAHGLGQAALDGLSEVLIVQSPSKKTEQIGRYAVEGFANGIDSTYAEGRIYFAVKHFSQNIIDNLTMFLSPESFAEVGQGMIQAIFDSMLGGEDPEDMDNPMLSAFILSLQNVEAFDEAILMFVEHFKELLNENFEMADSESPSMLFFRYAQMWIQGIVDAIYYEETLTTIILTITFLADFIKEQMDSHNIPDHFFKIGENAGQALADGLLSKLEIVRAAAEELAAAAEGGTSEGLDINSPSKVFIALGHSVGEGFVIGINDAASNVYDAAANLAENGLDGAETGIGRLQELINSELDFNPVITPMLDLSLIRSQMSELNALMNPDAYADINGQNGGKFSANPEGTQINFTQNNYSPKALSRMEIYRQTKNQISMMKGVVANA